MSHTEHPSLTERIVRKTNSSTIPGFMFLMSALLGPSHIYITVDVMLQCSGCVMCEGLCDSSVM